MKWVGVVLCCVVLVGVVGCVGLTSEESLALKQGTERIMKLEGQLADVLGKVATKKLTLEEGELFARELRGAIERAREDVQPITEKKDWNPWSILQSILIIGTSVAGGRAASRIQHGKWS